MIDLELLKEKREEYDKNTFELILDDIYKTIEKVNNKEGKNSTIYDPNYSYNSDIFTLNNKWGNKKVVKQYLDKLKEDGLKVKIRKNRDGFGDFVNYCLSIKW